MQSAIASKVTETSRSLTRTRHSKQFTRCCLRHQSYLSHSSSQGSYLLQVLLHPSYHQVSITFVDLSSRGSKPCQYSHLRYLYFDSSDFNQWDHRQEDLWDCSTSRHHYCPSNQCQYQASCHYQHY